jgi:predicted ATPase
VYNWIKTHHPQEENTVHDIKDIHPTNVHIKAQNFGPIEEAEIELRPLTVFVGESNTGKTYLAALIYALYGSFSGFARFPWSHHDVSDLHLMMRDSLFPKDKEITEALEKLMTSELPFRFSDLPQGIRSELESSLNDSEIFSSHLKRCFDLASVSDLIRFTGNSDNQMKVSLKVLEKNQTLWSFDTQISASGTTLSASINKDLVICSENEGEFQETFGVEHLDASLRQHSRETAQAYYLPATRRSIMQNYEVIAKSLIEGTTYNGSGHCTEIPPSSEIEVDFLKWIKLYQTRDESSDQITCIAKALEDEILGGAIEVERAVSGKPLEFFYRPRKAEQALPVRHSSSTVAELAPLVLLLHGVVQPGDLLIIEEPEAHLHPLAQTQIALTLARLVRAGVRVVVTTHSEWFIQQIGNLIREGEVIQLVKGSITPANWLLKEEVGAWWFSGGKPVKELPFDRIEGIEPQDYYDVADKLYESFTKLEQQLLDEEAASAIE